MSRAEFRIALGVTMLVLLMALRPDAFEVIVYRFLFAVGIE